MPLPWMSVVVAPFATSLHAPGSSENVQGFIDAYIIFIQTITNIFISLA